MSIVVNIIVSNTGSTTRKKQRGKTKEHGGHPTVLSIDVGRMKTLIPIPFLADYLKRTVNPTKIM